MKIASASFAEGAFIAPEFAYGRIGENGATERSENRNPELHWTDVPEGTKSFVVLCLDDDVPTDRQTKMGDGLLSVTQPRRRFVHWVQANIPAEVESIPEGFLTGDQKRNGAFGRPGVNDYVGNATPGPDGTGLGYDGPKGAYPIGPITDRPLFWFHARKLLGLKRTYGKPVPFYVMTSEANDAPTRACFEANDYFGLDRQDVFFFTQGMWPALDPQGKIILDQPGHIFMSPDGHGGVLAALDRSGALADMAARGIEHVFFFQVDNPMVDIADPLFVGLHAAKGADMTLKVCKKREAHEGMGVVVVRDGAYAMVEYSELSDEQMERTNPDGSLWLAYGSPAIHMFSRAFLQAEAARHMPLHLAHKKIAMVDDAGQTHKPAAPNGYKFEKFIFDVIPNAKTLVTLAFDRAEEFSPVKNAEGNDSPATAKRDLQAKWRRWLAQAGVTLPDTLPVEIDPAHALNAAQLKDKGLQIG